MLGPVLLSIAFLGQCPGGSCGGGGHGWGRGFAPLAWQGRCAGGNCGGAGYGYGYGPMVTGACAAPAPVASPGPVQTPATWLYSNQVYYPPLMPTVVPTPGPVRPSPQAPAKANLTAAPSG